MSNLLEENIQEAKQIYSKKGFQSRIGYGKKPAIINVDLANAWTRKGYEFSCNNMDKVINSVNELLEIARIKNVPIFFTTTAYLASMLDGGLWIKKIPSLKILKIGEDLTKIDSRLKPRNNEPVIVKKMASAFAGTGLQSMLTSIDIDTVIITGVTASSCIRHTVMDAISLGFRPIIPVGTISDRIPGAVDWNLFDIDAKFGDVEELQNVKDYLKKYVE